VFITVLAAQFPVNYQNLISALIILVTLLVASIVRRRQKAVL
jgi:hypothetical protein